MKFSWYNVLIDARQKIDKLIELKNAKGKYGKRSELEPLINSLYKNQRELTSLLRHTRETIDMYRNVFSKDNNDKMFISCNDLIKKIDNNINYKE